MTPEQERKIRFILEDLVLKARDCDVVGTCSVCYQYTAVALAEILSLSIGKRVVKCGECGGEGIKHTLYGDARMEAIVAKAYNPPQCPQCKNGKVREDIPLLEMVGLLGEARTVLEDALSVAEMEKRDLSLSPWANIKDALKRLPGGEGKE